jgi:hypothetical protein
MVYLPVFLHRRVDEAFELLFLPFDLSLLVFHVGGALETLGASSVQVSLSGLELH